jgi:hypothetical protein
MHMRQLWQEYLVPIGRLTPKSIERLPGSSSYYTDLIGFPVSQEEMQLFIHKTEQT